jgi:hypothetical protein
LYAGKIYKEISLPDNNTGQTLRRQLSRVFFILGDVAGDVAHGEIYLCRLILVVSYLCMYFYIRYILHMFILLKNTGSNIWLRTLILHNGANNKLQLLGASVK